MLLATLVGTALTVLLALPPPPDRGLRARLDPAAARAGRGAARRVLLVVAGLLGAVGFVLLGWTIGAGAGAVVALGVLLAAFTTMRLVVGHLRQRRAQRAQEEVARACGVLAAYLRVGQVATEGLRLAAQDCPVLDGAARIQQIGGDVVAVWRAEAQRPGHSGLADLARAWQVSSTTGSPLSASLEQVAAGLAADQTLRAVVAGELSAPRATGKVMAVLPLLGVGLGYLLGGDPLTWLLAGPLGWACLLAGLVLAAAGVTWIERLARDAAVGA